MLGPTGVKKEEKEEAVVCVMMCTLVGLGRFHDGRGICVSFSVSPGQGMVVSFLTGKQISVEVSAFSEKRLLFS